MDLPRRRQLIEIVRRQFRLEWQGIHGVPHWGRVRWNGLAMARVNGAREDIVELFAFLHDSQRFHDGTDREHGARAADYALELNREVLRLDRPGLELLTYAVRHHSDGLLEADLTVQTCWDADRLDLGRVGKTPRVEKLCTEEARDPVLRDLAYQRSLAETMAASITPREIPPDEPRPATRLCESSSPGTGNPHPIHRRLGAVPALRHRYLGAAHTACDAPRPPRSPSYRRKRRDRWVLLP